MSDGTDRIPHSCPACSPELETDHEVLREASAQLTIRCVACGHVHKVQPERTPAVTLDVVVSQDGESFSATVDTPADQSVDFGDEFILETEEAILTVRVTSLELSGDRRAKSALAEEIETVWTREVDNVSVNITVHPNDGSRDATRSITVYVPGDFEFTVGETNQFGSTEMAVDAIIVRDDASGYRRDRLEHDGDTVFAKDVKRLYAYDTSTTAWSVW